MRRSLTVLMSLGLMLGLGAIRSLVAQDDEPASPAPKAEAPQESEPKKDEAKPAAPATPEGETPAAPAAPTAPAATASPDELPTAVKEKRDAALKAVAELIVAAEQAGLVQTNLDPPPILDILVTGKATDKSALESAKGNAEAHVGLVNPEAFAAYFTGYAEPPEGLTAQANVRILQPSEGLKAFFDQRAEALRPFLDAARGGQPAPSPSADQPSTPPADAPASPDPAAPKEEMKKDEPKAEEPKAEEPKKEEPKDEPKAEEPKDEPKAEEPKTDEPKTDEPKAEEPKTEEPVEEPKTEEPKDEPSSDEPKDEEPSGDEPN